MRDFVMSIVSAAFMGSTFGLMHWALGEMGQATTLWVLAFIAGGLAQAAIHAVVKRDFYDG